MTHRAWDIIGALLLSSLLAGNAPSPLAGEPEVTSSRIQVSECLAQVRAAPSDHGPQRCLRYAAARLDSLDEVVSILRERRLKDPEDPLRWYFEGRALLMQSDEDATTVFRECNEALGANPWCLLGEGLGLEERGILDQSLGFIQHARSLDPTQSVILAAEIRVRTKLKELDRAEVMATSAMRRFEDQPEILLAIAHLRLAEGKIAESREAIQAARAIAPNDPSVFAALGALSEHSGAHDRAADHYQSAVALHPQSRRHREALAKNLVALGRSAAALSHYNHLQQRHPEHIEYMVQMGEVHLAAQSPQRALGWAETVLRKRQGDPDALELRARALIATGQLREGLAIRPVLYADPVDGLTHRLNIAKALAEGGHGGLAEAEFTDTVKRYPMAVSAWTTYANWYLQNGKKNRAEAVLRQALARLPANAEVHAALAHAFELQGHVRLAQQAFDRAVALQPERTEFVDNLARLEFQLGDTRKAVARWEELLAENPHSEVALRQLSGAYHLLEQHGDAAAVLERLVRRHPSDNDSLVLLGESYLKLEQRTKAIATLRAAIREGATGSKATGLLATALADTGQEAAAKATFEAALKADPGNRPLRLTYAYFCEKVGDQPGAVTLYRNQLARDPADPEALAGLTRTVGARKALLSSSTLRYPAAQHDRELKALVARVPPLKDREVSTVLRDERYVKAGPRGVDRVRHVRSILIRKPEGAKRYREVSISFHAQAQPKVVRARVLTPDGETITLPIESRRIDTPQYGPAMFGDARHLVLTFDGLEAGAILDYEVITYRPHPDLGSAWWDSYILGNSDPTVRVRYELSIPRSTKVHLAYPGLNAPRSIASGKIETLRWERLDLPGYGLTEAKSMQIPGVYVSSMSNWSEVDAWYTTLFAPQAEANSIVRIKAQDIEQRFSDRVDRIAAVYRFVEHNIRYLGIEFGVGAYKPRPADSTLAQGQGDCKDMTALMVALLSEMGIKSYPALVRPSGQGNFLAEHPSPGQFGHVLLYVPHSTGDYWLDATAGLGTIDAIPDALRGQLALIVDGAGGRLLRVPTASPKEHQLVEHRSYSLNMTGGGRVESRIQLTGDLAGLSRQKLINRDRQANASFLSAPGYLLGRGFIPDQVTITDLEQPTDPLRVTAQLSHPDLVAVRLNGSLVVSTDLDVFTNGLVSATGVSPILESPRTITRSVTLKPPAGYRFEWEPLNIHLPGMIDLKVTENRGLNETTIRSELTFSIRPGSEASVPDVLRAFSRAQAAFSRQLVISPGAEFSAVRFLSAIAAERPDDPKVLMHLGRALLMERQGREAMIVLQKALSISKTLPELWALTAAAHIQLGQLAAASELLRRVTESDYADPRLFITLAFLEAEQGDLGGATQTLSTAINRYPDDLQLRTEWVSLLARSGQARRAEEEMSSLAAAHPEIRELQLQLAQLAAQNGNTETARSVLQRLLQEDPTDAKVLNNLAWLMRVQPEERTEALALALRAVSAAPDMAEAWDTLAEIYVLEGRKADALQAIDQAILTGGDTVEKFIARRNRILRLD